MSLWAATGQATLIQPLLFLKQCLLITSGSTKKGRVCTLYFVLCALILSLPLASTNTAESDKARSSKHKAQNQRKVARFLRQFRVIKCWIESYGNFSDGNGVRIGFGIWPGRDQAPVFCDSVCIQRGQ